MAQRFRIGYQLLSWGRYYPPNWWEGCREVFELGFKGVEGEYVIANVYEGRRQEFTAKMKQYGVQLAALYSSADLVYAEESYRNVFNNLEVCGFLRENGAKVLVVGGFSNPKGSEEDFKRMAGVGNELGRAALEKYGIKVGYHPHLGSMVQDREGIGRLMDLTDPRYFFLAPDTGHLAAGGSDPVEVFRTYGKRIIHVHLKDYDPNAMGFGGRRGRTAPLGRGNVDFSALIGILNDLGYDGWADIEVDGTVAARETAEANKRFVVDKLGLTL